MSREAWETAAVSHCRAGTSLCPPDRKKSLKGLKTEICVCFKGDCGMTPWGRGQNWTLAVIVGNTRASSINNVYEGDLSKDRNRC